MRKKNSVKNSSAFLAQLIQSTMFSTSGYFRGVNCPYFASGLCERPYCHLRHVHQDDKGKAASDLLLIDLTTNVPIYTDFSLLQ